MKKAGLTFCLLWVLHPIMAQMAAPFLYKGADSLTQARILDSLTSLFTQIRQGAIRSSLIDPADSALNLEVFTDYRELMEKGTPQVINCYPLSARRYSVSTAFLDSASSLRAIITLVADTHNGNVAFSLPLLELTRTWQRKQVGNITYYYEGAFHPHLARAFDSNNTRIAHRLKMTPESFRFYLTDNYQDIRRLLGYTYDRSSNGRTWSGSLTGTHTIFAIRHSEDFSHDIFHWYSARVRMPGMKRNAAAEEGLAYSWGNAYYTDSSGRMITQAQLVAALRRYLEAHPGVSPWTLFNENPKILTAFAPELSVRSVISGLLCEEVWRRKGFEGIKALLNAGPGDPNYLNVMEDLIQVNKDNFDTTTRSLVGRP